MDAGKSTRSLERIHMNYQEEIYLGLAAASFETIIL